MIFDGHAYCFPSLRGTAGFSTAEHLRRHLQHAIANHFQPAFSATGRVEGDVKGLIDPSNWPSLDALEDSDFRAAGHGRFEWTTEGERYFKQYLPPSIVDMSYPAESLVAEMDYAGVDSALLHRTPYLGVGNEFIADCVWRFPDRLMGLAHVEEWLVESDPDEAISKVEQAIGEQGLSGFHFLPPQLNLYGQRGPWDGPGFRPFWDAVADLNVPVFFSLKGREDPVRDSYLQELKTLVRWMERYPEVTVVKTHGPQWPLFIEGDGISLPREVWEPFDNPNLYLQLLFPIGLGRMWDFPMPQVIPTIKECVERIGVHRLMWGTDMPMVTRFWTYRQNIDLIDRYCDFLAPEDRDALIGGTVARLLEASTSQ